MAGLPLARSASADQLCLTKRVGRGCLPASGGSLPEPSDEERLTRRVFALPAGSGSIEPPLHLKSKYILSYVVVTVRLPACPRRLGSARELTLVSARDRTVNLKGVPICHEKKTISI